MRSITAEYKYVYDPSHEHKPAGNWNRTGSGWSSNESDAAEPVRRPAHRPKEQEHTSKPQEFEIEEESTAKPAAPQEEDMEKVDLFDLDDEGSDFDTGDAEGQPAEKPTKEDAPEEEAQPAEEEQGPDGEQAQPEDNEEEQPEEPADEKEQPAEDEGVPESENEDENQEGDGSKDNPIVIEEEPESEDENQDGEPGQSEVKSDEKPEREDPATENGVSPFEQKEPYVDENNYDGNMEKMNSFIDRFDEGEGKENQITFKAVASNLDWDNLDEIKAFAEHCKKQGLDDADETLAFLYHQHGNDSEKFDKIIEEMK